MPEEETEATVHEQPGGGSSEREERPDGMVRPGWNQRTGRDSGASGTAGALSSHWEAGHDGTSGDGADVSSLCQVPSTFTFYYPIVPHTLVQVGGKLQPGDLMGPAKLFSLARVAPQD